jgi:phosphate transport system permease protein
VAVASPIPALRIADLQPDRSKRRRDRLARWVFFSAALASILITSAIVLTLAFEAIGFLSKVEFDKLTDIGWFPRRGLYDVPTLVVGTLIVSGIAMLVAVPFGLGAAIYLAEYASPRVRRKVKPVLELLAGIPSVVLGFFAISFITPEVLQKLKSDVDFFNLAASGIAVGILTLPLIASVSEDAMRAVPAALREGAYGLGGRKISVSLKVVFPAAISGIVAAIILGFSRAVGETMVVAIASGATGGSLFTTNIWGQGQTMTAAMAALGAGTDQVKGDDAASQSLFFIGILLFFITLGLNLIGDLFVRRVRERY